MLSSCVGEQTTGWIIMAHVHENGTGFASVLVQPHLCT